MSQAQKRTGARDISELKARLGLNKKGPAADKGAGGAQGGAVPPPGAQRSSAIPAPPGMKPPQPQVPDASEDPFGAMNAMATPAAPPQQDIVVVNDGQPVEKVDEGKKAAKYGKLAGFLLAPLIFGLIVGQISSSAKVYNRTIDDAAKVRDDVKAIGDGLLNVQNALLIGKERGKGGNAFKPYDDKLTQELEQVEVVKPDVKVAYHSFLYEIDPQVVDKVFSFYQETSIFYEDLQKHIKTTQNDAKALDRAESKLKEFTPFTYAAFVQIPEDKQGGGPASLPKVEIVQLGNPICGDNRPHKGCPGPPKGFQYRPDPSGPWGKMSLGNASGDKVSGKQLLLLSPNDMLESLIAGTKETVAQRNYLDRLKALETKLGELIERRKFIENKLNDKANESKKFTFFM